MEGYERKEGMDNDREEIYSKAVRAGKRTYFFDVKSTRNNDYYLTITESKKRFDNDGNQNFEKHKIFLYKEDFEKFAERLSAVLTEETKYAILKLKYETPESEKIMGVEYYVAVIRDGIRSYEEFMEWRIQHPVTGVMTWMP